MLVYPRLTCWLYKTLIAKLFIWEEFEDWRKLIVIMIAKYGMYLRNVVPTIGYSDDGHGHSSKDSVWWQNKIRIIYNWLIMIVMIVVTIMMTHMSHVLWQNHTYIYMLSFKTNHDQIELSSSVIKRGLLENPRWFNIETSFFWWHGRSRTSDVPLSIQQNYGIIG